MKINTIYFEKDVNMYSRIDNGQAYKVLTN